MAVSAKVKVSTALPPTKFSISVKSKVFVLVYCEVLGTSDQVLGRSSPVRVSSAVLPIRVLMFWKIPMKLASVRSNPSITPTALTWMSRAVAKAAKVRVSFALPPIRVSISAKVRVLVLVYWEVLGVSDQVLGKSKPMRVSVPFPPMRALILSNPADRPVAVPANPSVLPKLVNVTVLAVAFPA